MYLCSCLLIFFVCMITVAANLQKIVEEPQSNRSVTFKLVLTPVAFLVPECQDLENADISSFTLSKTPGWISVASLLLSLSEAYNPDLLTSLRKNYKAVWL